jgi:hypothetical protein
MQSGQGNKGITLMAVFSSHPIMTFRFWIAWPDAPLHTLSITDNKIALPGMRSSKTLIKLKFEPRTCLVCGTRPFGNTLQASIALMVQYVRAVALNCAICITFAAPLSHFKVMLIPPHSPAFPLIPPQETKHK